MTTKFVKTIAPWLAGGMLFVAAAGCEAGVEEEPLEGEAIEEEVIEEEPLEEEPLEDE
ncbi:MAG: hypothetical protein Kow00121_33470 [Elainellaceae cyanobacterium]